MDSVTHKVNAFYERYPYPSLAYLGGAYAPAKHADRIVRHLGLKAKDFGPGKAVLDLGCGTGEIACSLAFHGAKVTALDLCQASLARAAHTAKKYGVETVSFVRGDLQHLPFHATFDHVFSLGVLHHCKNSRQAFQKITPHVKPGGLLTLGLYSLFGKLIDRVDRQLFFLLGGNDLDRRIRIAGRVLGQPANSELERTYLADKHVHPHETYASAGEVLKWFDEAGFDFVAAQPAFDPKHPWLAELGWLWRQKAFFLVTGRKRIPKAFKVQGG